MSSRASWLSWIGGDDGANRSGDEVAELRRIVRERDAEIAALAERVQELGDAASRETERARALADRTDELSDLLGEAESACMKLEASLREADLRVAENEVRLTTESGRAEVASKLATTADERYRDVVDRWRNAEQALTKAHHERILAKEHQAELQLALSKAVQEREALRGANQKLQAQLKVAQFDKDDAAAVSSQRLVQVEQRARFAFDELECLGDDAHHLLRLVTESLWLELGDRVTQAVAAARSNVVQDWTTRRFAGCATTEEIVNATSDALSRLRLARFRIEQSAPLVVTVVPLGKGLSGADGIVRFAVAMLVRVVREQLGVELLLSETQVVDDGCRVSFRVASRAGSGG